MKRREFAELHYPFKSSEDFDMSSAHPLTISGGYENNYYLKWIDNNLVSKSVTEESDGDENTERGSNSS